VFLIKRITVMKITKILAFSDISDIWEWDKEYEEIVDEVKPNVVCLAGDLTSDGGLPKLDIERRRDHVEKFYKFLRCASTKSKVLVVKGNHDEDFEGDYVPERINRIQSCKEISGKFFDVSGLRFLGLGFEEAHKLRNKAYFSSLIDKFGGKIDAIVMHGENVRLASLLKPRVIIKGGFFAGRCRINNVPVVFTGPGVYVLIEVGDETLHVAHYRTYTRREVAASLPPFYKNLSWIKPW